MNISHSVQGGVNHYSGEKRIIEIEFPLKKLNKNFKLRTRRGEILLTPRELDCLYFLVLGLPAKISAMQLRISHRTVETHIEKIKNKLGCIKKEEIIDSIHYTIDHYYA